MRLNSVLLLLIISLILFEVDAMKIRASDLKVHTMKNDVNVWKLMKSLGFWNAPSRAAYLAMDILDEFDSRNCLIIVTNFVGVDIGKSRQPIIVRKPTLAVIHDKSIEDRDFQYQLTWVADRKGTKTSPNLLVASCLLYNQTGGRKDKYYPVRCSNLDYFRLAWQSKPWNCELTLNLPPTCTGSEDDIVRQFKLKYFPKIFPDFWYPQIWHYQWFNESSELKYREWFLPSQVSTIHTILISGSIWKSKVSRNDQIFMITSWIAPFFQSWNPDLQPASTPRNRIFLFSTLVPTTTHNSGVRLKVSSIKFVQILPQDRPDWISLSSRIHTGGLLAVAEGIEDGMWPLRFTNSKHEHTWGLSFPNCAPFTYKGNMRQFSGRYGYAPFATYAVLSHAFHILLANYSYRPYIQNFLCKNGRKISDYKDYGNWFVTEVDTKRPPRRNLHSPFEFQGAADSLQIVACGRRTKEPLPFQELVNVYELPVWVCIGLASLLTGLLYKYANHFQPHTTRSLPTQVFALVKVLLEQGDPFSGHVLQWRSARILSAAFLLMGIILSNGYKNNNVYNMVLPPKSLLYESLEQLVEHNVSMYTPMEYARFSINIRHLNVSKMKTDKGMKGNHNLSSCMNSSEEIIGMVSTVHVRLTHSGIFSSKEEAKFEEMVRNRTRLVPQFEIMASLAKWAKKKYLENPKEYGLTKRKRLSLEYKMLEEYNEMEMAKMESLLGKCKESPVAFLADANAALSIIRAKKSENVLERYLGKKSYTEVFYQSRFRGNVPVRIISRFGRWKASGIEEKWKRLLNAVFLPEIFYRSRATEENANSTENKDFIVVFSTLASGLLLAVAALLVELLFHRLVTSNGDEFACSSSDVEEDAEHRGACKRLSDVVLTSPSAHSLGPEEFERSHNGRAKSAPAAAVENDESPRASSLFIIHSRRHSTKIKDEQDVLVLDLEI